MVDSPDCPVCSWNADDPKRPLIYETQFWRIILAPNQALIGRCIVHLKRHEVNLAGLSETEIVDWLRVVGLVETSLKKTFGAILINWSCYMNLSYREGTPNPHVHWWAVPRYDRVVILGTQNFEDPNFSFPYDHSRNLEVSNDIQNRIAGLVKEGIA